MSSSSAPPPTQRILLIEDDEECADLLVPLLENAGYEVALATDWPYALLLALNIEADLVILDTALPGLSSRAATHVFHTAPDFGPRFRQVPFIYLADRSHIITQRFTRHPDLPISGYVFKPVDSEVFLVRVRRSLQTVEHTGTVHESATPEEVPPAE